MREGVRERGREGPDESCTLSAGTGPEIMSGERGKRRW